MKFKRLVTAVAFETNALGEKNQIKGLATALTKAKSPSHKAVYALNRNMFIKNITPRSLRRSDYETDKTFEEDIFLCLDNYFRHHLLIPRIFITAYIQAEKENAAVNADELCRLIKKYYQIRQMGRILTVVMTSGFGVYKYADIVNTPYHMLSEKELSEVKKNADKFFISSGIIHNMTKTFIRQKWGQKRLQQFASRYNNGNKNIIICLGGTTQNNDIIMGTDEINTILERCRKLKNKGFNVIIISGPRTPNEICDYLYEQDIDFYNGKKIAADDEERKNWRIYSGKYEYEFAEFSKKYGNIYPGILGLKNTLAVHTFDSFAVCETASSGIPSAICSDVKINKERRSDCYRLRNALISDNYAIDFADYNGACAPDELCLKILPNVNRVLAEIIIKKMENLTQT